MTVALLDHFRPPLSSRRHWQTFHNAWATYLASDLNARLPTGYFAEPNVQFGIEIDVAAFDERDDRATSPGPSADDGKTAATLVRWSPAEPSISVPFEPAAETVEVLVYDSSAGPVLAAAVELISPANKDRPAHRQAFIAKCEAYLHSGAGLVMVDVVTERNANLCEDLLARLGSESKLAATSLYAAACHPVSRDEAPVLDVWFSLLQIGESLPTLPLWLRGGLCLPLDLSAAYERTCREQRISI